MSTWPGFAAMLALILVGACSVVPSREDSGHFVKRDLVMDGAAHRYQVFVPSQAAGGAHPPVILFLHGSGERGDDGDKPVAVGIGTYVRAHLADFPAIVVFPQAPDNSEWSGTSSRLAFGTLDAATREFHGDASRTYLTGLSMGGYGVWELALLQPQRFAALVPVSGAIRPPNDERALFVTPVASETDPYAALARRLRAMPIWIFHGAKDDVVPLEDDRRTTAALKAAGNAVRYTEFPDANHNAWDPAYATPDLWAWLFAQHR
ncbi:MAG: phospholipase [Xanthomonadaceae bacterium]|nr:phospholipase [Xanthomonadaceae bacterium]